eukprot:8249980-Pyramimonas_sp.AAC.1
MFIIAEVTAKVANQLEQQGLIVQLPQHTDWFSSEPSQQVQDMPGLISTSFRRRCQSCVARLLMLLPHAGLVPRLKLGKTELRIDVRGKGAPAPRNAS